MKIACDFDSTLTRNIERWIQIYNKKYNEKITLKSIRKWNFWEELNITKQEFLDIMRIVWKNWNIIRPQEPDEYLYVSKIKQFGILDIVTGVENEYIYAVKNWLFLNNIPHDDLYHSDNKSTLNYDVFIDDNPILAQQLSGKHEKIMLMPSRPWNLYFPSSGNIRRVYSWKDIYEKINIIATMKNGKNGK